MAWRDISISRQLTFEGGYMTKTCTLETREIYTQEGERSFVKIDKGCEWLNRAAVGQKACRTSLKRSRVFEEMKNKLIFLTIIIFCYIQLSIATGKNFIFGRGPLAKIYTRSGNPGKSGNF